MDVVIELEDVRRPRSGAISSGPVDFKGESSSWRGGQSYFGARDPHGRGQEGEPKLSLGRKASEVLGSSLLAVIGIRETGDPLSVVRDCPMVSDRLALGRVETPQVSGSPGTGCSGGRAALDQEPHTLDLQRPGRAQCSKAWWTQGSPGDRGQPCCCVSLDI